MSDYQPRTTRQTAQAEAAGAPPLRRRRRSPLTWLIIVLVALLIILGIGDQVAKSVAQNDIASQIQSSSGLSAKPSVSIKGWPFLTQVLAHDVNTIDISASNVTASGSKIPFDLTATATGVHLNSSFNGGTVDHINGQVTFTYKSLDNYLGTAIGIPGLSGISISPDPANGPNSVKADAGVGSVTATVVKTGPNQMTIKFGSLSGLASLAGSIPDQVIDIPNLPAGLVLGTPTATSQGIVIPASANNTTFKQ